MIVKGFLTSNNIKPQKQEWRQQECLEAGERMDEK